MYISNFKPSNIKCVLKCTSAIGQKRSIITSTGSISIPTKTNPELSAKKPAFERKLLEKLEVEVRPRTNASGGEKFSSRMRNIHK